MNHEGHGDSAIDDGKKEQPSLQGIMNRKQRKKLEKNIQDVNVAFSDCYEVSGDDDFSLFMDVLAVHVQHQDQLDDDVGEIFSLPRITPVAEKKGLKSFGSMDLGNGWNFLKKEHRDQCRREIKEKKPRVLVVCPPCGPFSSLQNLNENKGNAAERERKRVEGEVLLAFALEICELQRASGRVFVFEHPKRAGSWKCDSMERLRNQEHVHEVVLDQCCFGLVDPQNGKFYQKGTRLLTNSKHTSHLHRTCPGNHQHQRIEGQVKLGGQWVNRSRVAQVYPKKFVEALVKLVEKECQDQCFEVFGVDRIENQGQLETVVRRCHVNLGHPSRERFIHMLKSANASQEAIEMAKKLKCSTCSYKRLQESHPVAKHRRAEVFNEQICMDVFDLPIYQNKVLKMLNIVDEGTNMQLCVPLWKGAKAVEVRRAYRKWWKRWAGVPKRVLTDGGTEFDHCVQEGFDNDGSFVEKTAAHAPWQNGLVERNGGIWKDAFAKAFEETQPKDKLEVNELIDQVNVARNSMCRRHGFSPYQHVFGSDLRLPGLVTNGEPMDHFGSDSRGVHHSVDGFWNRHHMRMAARKAFTTLDDDDKVRRAVQHRSRPARTKFAVGQLVYYWRRLPTDGKKGTWRGPARIIGFHDSSKIWVGHGNKVLRCAPEQVRALSEDQEAAVKFVPVEILSKAGRFAKRGAQTYTDISQQGAPVVGEDGEPESKRQRTDEQHDDEDAEIEEPFEQVEQIPPVSEGEIDEESTADVGTEQSRPVSLYGNDNAEDHRDRATSSSGATYGPTRARHSDNRFQPLDNPLNQALRRSADLLDMGSTRLPRTPLQPSEALEVTVCEFQDQPEVISHSHFETFMAGMTERKNAEVKDSELTETEKENLNAGKKKELNKLQNTSAIKIHMGEDAKHIRATVDEKRILESRFVKTRRENPDSPGETEIKCRWVVKGFQDPDLDVLERQSPTLSADGLAMVLQVIASMQWIMTVADVEGAFLQGEKYDRDTGKIYTSMPPGGFPGIPQDSIFELTKCVYGLMDAPLRWWRSLTTTFRQLGVKQSVLDPCVFFWFHEKQCQGIFAVHVDDILFGGTDLFHEKVVCNLKQRYPFKHWKQKHADFLGRRLIQHDDFSISIDQQEYAKQVKTANLNKERRKEKDEALTSKELQQFRAILGAANWIVGSTRPDIAAHTALLQQRVSKAVVGDLIEANKLVAKIRDHAHMKIWIQSIPFEEAVVAVTSDASWSNAQALGSQAGYLIMLAHKNLKEKRWAKISPLRWKSYKMDRKTQSTLGAELMAVSRAIAEGDWLRSLLAEARFSDYSLEEDAKFRKSLGMMICIDNKPIFDHVHGEGIVVRDKRLAIDMLLVRRDLRQEGTNLHWIDTRQMLSDALTKIDVNCDFLRFVLRFGKYIVFEESDSLQWRREERMSQKGT
jgi:hypothetical protein